MIHFLKYTFKNSFLFLTNRYYRTFLKLFLFKAGKKRYKPCKVSFQGYDFDIPDALSFVWQYKEIFVDRAYEFKSSRNAAIILDCGANVGLSALFFRIHYPEAKIIAFEADPDIAAYLIDNLKRNDIRNVNVIAKAVWINDNDLEFGSEGADGGSIHTSGGKKVTIKATRLKDVIDGYESIDMLKMDIEGAEREVLDDCSQVLGKVKNIFVEYHDYFENPQYLSDLTSILELNGFRYYISSPHLKWLPMQPQASQKGMDLQLNIFAHKRND